VREELAQSLQGDDVSFLCCFLTFFGVLIISTLPIIYAFLSYPCLELEAAVEDEMTTFREEWENVLDELETESYHLLVCFFPQFE
jgi:hypothetical protein